MLVEGSGADDSVQFVNKEQDQHRVVLGLTRENAPQDARQYALLLLQLDQQQMLAVYFAVLAPHCLALGFL